ncbi:MAG: hypothetical protein QOJ50_2665 [Cryptosporangiaceae bacterium]|nr:hypothetical protein [Cryptosporangiaceae bacterium]
MTAPAATAGPPGGTESSAARSAGRAGIRERTLRTDRWWIPPLVTAVGLAAWVLYALVRTAMQKYYWVGQYGYLTPFYSPCLTQSCAEGAAHFGRPLPKFPPLVPFGIVALPFLLGFRLTCYYYRKAYYRAFWLSPPACAVAEPHAKYTGETRFPLILQNIHRYFFYAAAIISVINTYDAIEALHGAQGFRLGLGNLILIGNVVALWAYTISCHSCRHIAGGRLKHFSKHPARYWMWTQVSKLNARHMLLAWLTLGTLAFTDAYIALVASGAITDIRFIN